MANTFKVGDKVLCRKPDDTMTLGAIYTVRDVDPNDCMVMIDGLKGDWWRSSARFEPAPTAAGPPTITDSHGVQRRVVALSDILAVIDEHSGDDHTKTWNAAMNSAKHHIRKLFTNEVDDDGN